MNVQELIKELEEEYTLNEIIDFLCDGEALGAYHRKMNQETVEEIYYIIKSKIDLGNS